MAGAFSGHLVDSFNAQQARYPVPFGSQTTNLIASGPMSFNPQMHGTPAMGNQSMGDCSFSFNSPHSAFNPELSEATTLKIAALQAKLNQKLGPEYISQRPGPGGGPKLTYAEGWKIINLANEVFGFNGWSSSVVSLTTDFIDYNEESKRYNVGTTAIVRVTLRDGVFHEDIGSGMLENSKSKGAALDKCKKEAVTDGLKRAIRNFGNLLGNCLYDKTYTQEVVKMKVAPPKFDKSGLHRRPEFEETKPNVASTSKFTLSSASDLVSANQPANNFVTPTRPGAAQTPQPQTTVVSSIPSHLRTGAKAAGPSRDTGTSTNNCSIQAASNAQLSVPRAADPAKMHQTTHHTTYIPQSDSAPASILPKSLNASGGNSKPRILNASNARQPATGTVDPQPQRLETEEAVDESYHFYSDDDAFLAMVDLGEGDLGQPLLPETDLGRPIDGDEDDTDVHRAGVDGDQQPSPVNSSATHAEETRQQPQQGQQAGGVLSRLLPQNQHQPQQQPYRSSNQFNPPPKPPPQQAVDQNQQRRRTHNQPTRSHPQDQNQQSTSAATASTGQRPSTPSMGGFHFPPGVDPRTEHAKQPVPPQGQGSVSGIGLKRPLDSISASTHVRPGMGANARPAGAGATQGQVKREVFGRLDLGECGDVKRARR